MSKGGESAHAMYDRIVNMFSNGFPTIDFSVIPLPPAIVVNKAVNETVENLGEFQKLELEKQKTDIKKEEAEIAQIKQETTHPNNNENTDEKKDETNENTDENTNENTDEKKDETDEKTDEKKDEKTDEKKDETDENTENKDDTEQKTETSDKKLQGGGKDQIKFTKEECSFF